MTREDFSARRDDAQRLVDRLADLFDDVAPADRAAAEEELREAGADPARVGRRLAAHAADALGGSLAHGSEDSRRVSTQLRARPSRRPATGPMGAGAQRHRRIGAAIARSAAVLLVGVAIGWLLARGASPPPRIAEVPRRSDRPSASERWGGVVGRDLPPVRSGQAPDVDEGNVATGPAAPQGSGGAAAGQGGTQSGGDAHGAPAAEAANADSSPGDAHGFASDAGDEVVTDADVAGEGDGGDDSQSDRWILEQSNWEEAKNLLPPPILERVKSGDYWFTVQSKPPWRFTRNYSPRFWAESEANAGRYVVDPATCGLLESGSTKAPSFYFGLPFPAVAVDNPNAGCEVMWNVSATAAIDGGRETDLTLDLLTPDPNSAARRAVVRLYAMAFQGRQSGPTANPDDARAATLLDVSAPSDLNGTDTLMIRPNDASVRDKTWSYVPALRRIRAVSPANRSDGVFGFDLAPDDFECFDGKLEDFTWKMVGTTTVLAPMTTLRPSERSPLSSTRAEVPLSRRHAVFESPGAHGAPWLVVENLTMVPRPVWVVEGIPRDRYYLYGKLILYLDQELYRPYWRLAFTWQGEYAGHTICAQHWSYSPDQATTSGTAATLTSVNERVNRGTLTRATSQVVDQGLDEGFFRISKMIELAH